MIKFLLAHLSTGSQNSSIQIQIGVHDLRGREVWSKQSNLDGGVEN